MTLLTLHERVHFHQQLTTTLALQFILCHALLHYSMVIVSIDVIFYHATIT